MQFKISLYSVQKHNFGTKGFEKDMFILFLLMIDSGDYIRIFFVIVLLIFGCVNLIVTIFGTSFPLSGTGCESFQINKS